MNLKNIILSKLFIINAIKQGEFVLKSGEKSNYYFDMRVIMSYPNIYAMLLEYANQTYPEIFSDIDIVLGIEFGGLPLANCISQTMSVPQILVRKETKQHGLQKQIEGNYNQNSKVLLVEDVITTGMSVQEKLDQIGTQLIASKILVILNRNNIESIQNIKVCSLFTMQDVLDFTTVVPTYYLNSAANFVYTLAIKKQSNIILSCDLDNCVDVLSMINKVGDKIVGVKLHVNIINDFNCQFIDELLKLKEKYEFAIIEDGKFADIGNIVIKQLDSIYKINKWADLITVHSVTGDGIVKSISEKYPHLGLLLISELSTKNNLINDSYVFSTMNIYNANKNQVSGFICQTKVFNHIDKFETLTFSPGINFNATSDNHDQTYRNPSSKTTTGLFWIIGRGIYESNNPEIECEKYRTNGWEHLKRF